MLQEMIGRLEREVTENDWVQLHASAQRLKREVLSRDQAPFANLPVLDAARSYLVTGGAGFIGSHVARRLLELGNSVVALDEFNDYYDPALKWENVADLLASDRFELYQLDIRDATALRAGIQSRRFDAIIHLAARAGVRPSITDPGLYVTTNVLGTQNMLDFARDSGASTFVYASSSSVYGGSIDFPFSETQNVDAPISPYAATKKANELQAACYSRLYGLSVSGLRFFTVYGPAGRPDMAVRLFIEKLARGEPVPLYGDGSFERDYTYIDDIVEGVIGAVNAGYGKAGWNEVFNLGESDTTSVLELILLIAKELGRINVPNEVKHLTREEQSQLVDELANRGLVTRLPPQLGDVPKTFADVGKARRVLGYQPQVDVAEGIRRTVRWHLEQQRAAIEPARKRILQALRVQCGVRVRAGLDSMGRSKGTTYESADARNLVEAIADLSSFDYVPADAPLGERALRELVGALCDVAAALCQSRPSPLSLGS
jgi:UDP-glucuronate 4-epimerase